MRLTERKSLGERRLAVLPVLKLEVTSLRSFGKKMELNLNTRLHCSSARNSSCLIARADFTALTPIAGNSFGVLNSVETARALQHSGMIKFT